MTAIVCAKCEATDGVQHQAHLAQQERAEKVKGYHPPGGRYWTAKREYPDWIPDT